MRQPTILPAIWKISALPYTGMTGHTGCWAMIEGGNDTESGKTILLRADIDALPIQEETGLPYSSEHPGVFHGCGHETHAAMLLIACKMLVEIKEELPW